MIELSMQYLLGSSLPVVRIETRQQKNGVHSIRLRALDALWFQRAMTGERDKDRVIWFRAREQTFELAQDCCPIYFFIYLELEIGGPRGTQRCFDVAGVRGRTLERF